MAVPRIGYRLAKPRYMPPEKGAFAPMAVLEYPRLEAMFDQAPKVSGHNSWKQTMSASIRASVERMALYLSLPTAPVPNSML